VVKPLADAQRRLGKAGRPRKPEASQASAPLDGAENADKSRRSDTPRQMSPKLCPRLLDVDAAGAYLGVSPWTIRDLHTSGRLPIAGDRELRRLLFDVRDLDRLIESSKEAAN
jgi:hypothetical protein